MIKLLVFAAVVTVVAAEGKKCPWVVGKYPFDDSKFVGEWNMIAGTQKKGGPYKCGKIDYKITKDIHSGRFSGIKDDGTKHSGEFYGQAFGKEFGKSSAYLAVWKKDGGPYSPLFKQVIPATDYDNFALYMGCAMVYDEKTKTFERKMKAGILSRNKTLDPEILNTLKNVLSSYDVDPNELVMFDQTGC